MASDGTLVLRVPLGPRTHAALAAIAETPGPEEFLSSPVFWGLSVFILLNSIWVREQYDRYMDLLHQARFTSIQSPKAAELLQRPTPTRFFWLQPHLTTYTRWFFAWAISSLVVPLQLLELKWGCTLGWRLTVVAVNSLCHCGQSTVEENSLWLDMLICIPSMIMILLTWLYLGKMSIGMIFTQLAYSMGLRWIRPQAPLDLSHRAHGGITLNQGDTN